MTSFEHHLGLPKLHQRADHREHDAHIAQDAGPHDGPKLALEHRDVVQAHADGAVAEEGIALGVGGLGLRVFVGAEIERADDQRAALQAPQRVGIGAVMLFLAGLVIAGEIEKFGAIEADAFSAAAKGVVDLGGEFDIGLQADDMPVEGLRGQILQRGAVRFRAARRRLSALAIFGQCSLVGVDDDDAVIAVDDDGVAAGDFGGDVPRPTTAGMPMARATMAVWLVRPPTSVAKPFTCLRSSAAVWLGSRSWAMTTTSLVRCARSCRCWPIRRCRSCRSMSWMSLTRSDEIAVGHLGEDGGVLAHDRC